MSDLDDLQLKDGDRLIVSGALDEELEVTVVRESATPLIDIRAVMQAKRLAAFTDGQVDWNEHDYVLCRNDLPFRLRITRDGASNKCHAQVPIPNEGDLRFLRCPNCGQAVFPLYGQED